MALGEKRVLAAPGHPGAPLRQRSPLPWVSWSLLGLSVLFFFYLDPRLEPPSGLPWGALFGPAVVRGDWYRLLAHVVEHGSAIHLLFNMSVVYTLGAALERAISSWRFLWISIVTALGSAAAGLLFSFDRPTVGASGMILGWAGAMLPIATAVGRRELVFWLVQVAVISLLPNVSWQAHVGGFALGLPCGLLLRNRARNFARLMPLVLAVALALAVGAANVGSLHPAFTRPAGR